MDAFIKVRRNPNNRPIYNSLYIHRERATLTYNAPWHTCPQLTHGNKGTVPQEIIQEI